MFLSFKKKQISHPVLLSNIYVHDSACSLFVTVLDSSDTGDGSHPRYDVIIGYFVCRKNALVQRPRASQVELHRFSTLVHDRVSRAVRRMDRINVGLFAGRGTDVYTVLLGYRRHRQSSGT